MRMHAFAVSALLVAGCGSPSTTNVTTSSTPPTSGDGGAPLPGDMGSPGGGGGGGVDGGSGGVDGGGGMACSDTQPVAIATAGGNAFALAVDDTNAYFTAVPPGSSTDSVWRAPLSGGAAVEVAHSDQYIRLLAVNATAFFVGDSAGNVWRYAKAGGAPTALRTAGPVGNSCLADAFGYIYYCNNDAGNVQIVRVPEDGGGTGTIIGNSFGLTSIAFDPQHLWFDGVRDIYAVAPDGSGGSAITIPWNGSTLGFLAVDDTHVFAGTQAEYIVVADKRDGATVTNFAQTPGLPGQLLVDGGNLYVVIEPADARNRHSSIMRYAIDGSSTTTLLGMAGTITRMAIRGPYVYFVNDEASTVYRVCK